MTARISELLHSWISYETPPSQSPRGHLFEVLLQRIIASVTVQGVFLILLAPVLAWPLAIQGGVFLLLTSAARLARRTYGARKACLAAYIGSLIFLVPQVAVTGGVYSYSVSTVLLLTIVVSFAVEVRTTLWTLAGYTAWLGIMAYFQRRGLWFPVLLTPSPGMTWLLRTQTTINIMVPIVTAIQAFREALGRMERSVGELREAEKTTRALLDSQSRLFWDISHELRSPLTRLNLSVGKVRREVGARSEQSLERMQNEVERLNKLIHQLLLLAQLKHGVQFPMNEPIDLAAEIAAVCQDAEFEASVAGRELKVELDGVFPMQGCGELLRGAVENVVRNAIRFAPEGSEIEVRLSQPAPGLACIDVSDRGPGVPESQIGMLFDPFFRVTPDGNAPVQRTGSGLGLAIAFEAVKKHGGRISAVNRAEGGLVVTMEVPGGQPRSVILNQTEGIGTHVSSGQ